MSIVTDSDDGWIDRQYMYNWFEIACVPAGTRLLQCRNPTRTTPSSRSTYCTSPVQAVHAFAAAKAYEPDATAELCVCKTTRDMYVFDLDPLQYTRAYSDEHLGLYTGASTKAQKRRILLEIETHLNSLLEHNALQLDSLRLLSDGANAGIAWSFEDCMDEVSEQHALAGLVAAPAGTLFAPPTLRLLDRRSHIDILGRITLSPQVMKMLLQTPLLHDAPLLPLTCTDDNILRVFGAGLAEPTGFTSLNETGWKETAALRNELRLQIATVTFNRPDAIQRHTCNLLQQQCDSFFAT